MYQRYVGLLEVKNQSSVQAGQDACKDEDVYNGRVWLPGCYPPFKMVRLYIGCDSPAGTVRERDWLRQHAYPRVSALCRRKGYEFHVIDTRWQPPEEGVADYLDAEICKKELKLCQQYSIGPSFVAVISKTREITACPNAIAAPDFWKILHHVNTQEIRDLFKKMYKLDDTSVPPSYRLVTNSNQQERDKCTEECVKIRTTLDAICQLLDKETPRKYILSDFELEIQQGFKAPGDISQHCLWLEKEGGYTQTVDNEEQGSRQMVQEFYTEVSGKLPPSRRIKYSLQGDDASVQGELEKMAEEFVTTVEGMIETSVANRKEDMDEEASEWRGEGTDLEEWRHHFRLCHTFSEGFGGREQALQVIKEYLIGDSQKPFLLHGPKGSGKTSTLAMVAKMAGQWMNSSLVEINSCLVVRFIGTSKTSKSLQSLLDSITYQLRQIRPNDDPYTHNEKMSEVVDHFQRALYPSKRVGKSKALSKPLLLILDAVDQLEPVDDCVHFNFLKQGKKGPKIIFSMRSDPGGRRFRLMKAIASDEKNILELSALGEPEAREMMLRWQQGKTRRLSTDQMNVVLQHVNAHPTPLNLKMSFENTFLWQSPTHPENGGSDAGVRACVDFRFGQLEKRLGQTFVSRAVSYLTSARDGITEVELADILSCDDDVMNEVYTNRNPSTRRMPSLLLARFLDSVRPYLGFVEAGGVNALCWFPEEFREAVTDRYCSNSAGNQLVHGNMADFFHRTLANAPKGGRVEADRHVDDQPLVCDDQSYNVRSLAYIPYHRTKAGQLDLLLDQCLTNVQFMLHKLEAAYVPDLIEDYKLARQTFPECGLLELIHQALNTVHRTVMDDRNQLINSMLQRLPRNEQTDSFLRQCERHPMTYILPVNAPVDKVGGQLVQRIYTRTDGMIGQLDLTKDGKYVLMVSDTEEVEYEVSVWDVAMGDRIWSTSSTFSINAYFCKNDERVVILKDGPKLIHVHCRSLLTGEKLCSVSLPECNKAAVRVCMAGPTKNYILNFTKTSCIVYDLENKLKMITSITLPAGTFQLDCCSLTARGNIAAMLDCDCQCVGIIDLNKQEVSATFRAFEPKPEKNVDSDTTKEADGEAVNSKPEREDENAGSDDNDSDEGGGTKKDKEEVKTNKKRNKKFEEDSDDEDDDDDEVVMAIAVHPDEKRIAYAGGDDRQLVLTDLQGNKLNTVTLGIEFKTLEFTDNGDALISTYGSCLGIYDSTNLQLTTSLKHPGNIGQAVSNDGKIYITTGQSESEDECDIWVWDMSRDADTSSVRHRAPYIKMESGLFLFLSNPRYMVACGRKHYDNEDDPMHLVLLDVIEGKVMRKCLLKNPGESSAQLKMVDPAGTQVILSVGKQLYSVNIATMTTTTRFQGIVNNYQTDGYSPYWLNEDRDFFHVVNGNSVVCRSKGNMNVKVYDATTGLVDCILTAGQESEINNLVVNELGTMAVAFTEEEFMLFDLKQKTYLRKVTDNDCKYIEHIRPFAAINKTATRLLYLVAGAVCDFDKDDGENDVEDDDDDDEEEECGSDKIDNFDRKSGCFIVCWDLENDKEICRMYNIRYTDAYTFDRKVSGDVVFEEVDEDKMLIGGLGDSAAIFSYFTGDRLGVLQGSEDIDLVAVSNTSPYIVTTSDESLQLWDKQTYACVASYTPQNWVSDLRWSKDGRFFMAHTRDPFGYTVYGIYNDGKDVKIFTEQDYPEEFTAESECTDLDLGVDADAQPAADDPDTDPGPKSDEEDDDGGGGDEDGGGGDEDGGGGDDEDEDDDDEDYED